MLYFDLFDYPLKPDEIYFHLQSDHVSKSQMRDELQKMISARVLFQEGDFFSVRDDSRLHARRIEGNRKAEEYKKKALCRSKLIYKFPFVRAVMISGSLSKNYADDKTDIDFFIVTAPDRMWIARTFLVLFKRIFFFNSHKYFCVNYFVDEDHLEIEEKNVFTATELSTLMPVIGSAWYHKLLQNNSWIQGFFPHVHQKIVPADNQTTLDPLKKGMEWFLTSGLGHWLDKKFMMLTIRRWQRLYGLSFAPADFSIAFKSTKHVSKNHPENFQRRILEQYKKKLEEFSIPA
jgi:hypothetical protein